MIILRITNSGGLPWTRSIYFTLGIIILYWNQSHCMVMRPSYSEERNWNCIKSSHSLKNHFLSCHHSVITLRTPSWSHKSMDSLNIDDFVVCTLYIYTYCNGKTSCCHDHIMILSWSLYFIKQMNLILMSDQSYLWISHEI